MRIMPDFLLLQTALLLFLLIAILFLLIYLSVYQQKTVFMTSLRINIFFLGTLVLCLLLMSLRLDLPNLRHYQVLSKVLFLLTGCHSGINIIFYEYAHKKNRVDIYSTVDLRSIINKTKDLVVLYDQHGKVIELNEAAFVFKDYFEKTPIVPGIITTTEEQIDGRWYSVQNKLIYSGKGAPLALVKMLHQIDQEKELIRELERHNQVIVAKNEKLMDYLKIADELESERIRLKLVQEVQMLMVIEIEKVIQQIKEAIAHQTTLERYQYDLTRIADDLRKILKKVRLSVQKIKNNTTHLSP